MIKRIFLVVLFSIFFFKNVFAVDTEVNPLYLNEGLTENQIMNIKLFTTRAENLVLDAYSSLNQRRKRVKQTIKYLNASLFFLNEAKQYSPSYFIKRQFEAIEKRIDLYPGEDYSDDLKSLYVYIEEIAGNLDNYREIKRLMLDVIKNAEMRQNSFVKDKIDILMEKIKIKLIDTPINEAENLIGIAKDHLKARNYRKTKQALELALEPLIKISARDNLYIALVREYIYKAYRTYDYDQIISLRYVDSALIAINKAYYVAIPENKDIIKKIRKKILQLPGIFDNKKEAEKIFTDIIRLLLIM